eukprot:7727369-Pyramimonas_sp.AAC.1
MDVFSGRPRLFLRRNAVWRRVFLKARTCSRRARWTRRARGRWRRTYGASWAGRCPCRRASY